MEKETGFWPAIKDFFFRAGDFKGVSSRSQYWWVFLAQFLLGIVIGLVSVSLGATFSAKAQSFGSSMIRSLLTTLVAVPMYLSYPQLSLTLRRFRDAKVNPWLYLVLVIVALVGPLLTANGMGLLPMIILPLIVALVTLIILLLPSREQTVKPFPAHPHTGSTTGVGFGAAVKDLFLRGGDFTGTSSRSQYWWNILFVGLIFVPTFLFLLFSITAALLGSAALGKMQPQNIINMINSLGIGAVILVAIIFAVLYGWSMVALPMLTVTWRRFKDAGVSPWWFIALNIASSIVSAVQGSAPNVPLNLVTLILLIAQIVILALPPKVQNDEA